jgi:hypothetical protein
MSRVGFEPTIPVFEQAKTVHAVDRAATVIGPRPCRWRIYVPRKRRLTFTGPYTIIFQKTEPSTIN